MKINVTSVFRDHFATLYNVSSGRLSIIDFAVFYIIPIICGIYALLAQISLNANFYNLTVTFFGIFVALLLNIQVAIFSIFQRKWDLSVDEKIAEIQTESINERKLILRELNANVSYLTIVCCISMTFSMIVYALDAVNCFSSMIVLAAYAHFTLVLLMIIKRSHALFSREYSDSI